MSESEAPFREVAAGIQRQVVNESTQSNHPFRVLRNRGVKEWCRWRALHLGSRRHFKVKTRVSRGEGGNQNNQTFSSCLNLSYLLFLLFTCFRWLLIPEMTAICFLYLLSSFRSTQWCLLS